MLHVIIRIIVISPNSITSICCEFPSKSTTCCATTSATTRQSVRVVALFVLYTSPTPSDLDLWKTQELRCVMYDKSTAQATFKGYFHYGFTDSDL